MSEMGALEGLAAACRDTPLPVHLAIGFDSAEVGTITFRRGEPAGATIADFLEAVAREFRHTVDSS